MSFRRVGLEHQCIYSTVKPHVWLHANTLFVWPVFPQDKPNPIIRFPPPATCKKATFHAETLDIQHASRPPIIRPLLSEQLPTCINSKTKDPQISPLEHPTLHVCVICQLSAFHGVPNLGSPSRTCLPPADSHGPSVQHEAAECIPLASCSRPPRPSDP